MRSRRRSRVWSRRGSRRAWRWPDRRQQRAPAGLAPLLAALALRLRAARGIAQPLGLVLGSERLLALLERLGLLVELLEAILALALLARLFLLGGRLAARLAALAL